MIDIKLSGLDEIQKALNKIQTGLKEIEGRREVSFNDLFNRAFLSKHSSFSSFDEMLEKSGLQFESVNDFGENEEWNKFVAQNTRFSSWDDMLKKATSKWAGDKLGFK